MYKYVVYNINTNSIVKLGNNPKELATAYSGRGYKVLKLVPADIREEW